MTTKKGYKKNNLGFIPKGWEIKKLEQVSIISGEYGINAAGVDFDENLPKYLRITDINDDGTLRLNNMVSVNDPNSQKYLLQNDDILLARTGASVGKAYRHKQKEYGDLVFAGFLIRFRLNTQVISPTFLHFYLQTNKYWNWVQVMSQRSGQPGINGKEYSVLPIPLPPLPEQQKIATILSKWDKAIDKLTQLIAAKELQKKGLMQQLLTGELRFSGFEDEWEEVKLGEIVQFLDGRRKPLKSDDRNQIQGDIPYYGASGIIDYVNDYIFNEEIVLLGEDGENILSRNTRLVYHVVGKCWVNNHTHVLKPLKNVDGVFLTESLEMVNYLKYNSGTAQPKLNKATCEKIIISIPTVPEQQKIASVLSVADKEIEILKKELANLQEQKKGLMQVLLTGEKRVNI